MERDALTLLGLTEKVDLVRGSILAPDALKLVDGCDAVVHLASVAGVPTVVRNPAKTMRVTLDGTLRVLEASLRQSVGRFINISTSEVYGPYAYRATEDTPTALPPVGESPRWSYAVAKLAAEHLVESYHYSYGLPAVNVRPCNVYGPAQIGVGAVNNFIRAAASGAPLTIYGDGTQIRSWCHIEDMVRLLVACLESDLAVGRVFNAGNPHAVLTTNELARRVADLTGAEIVREPAPYPDVEIRVLDVTRARNLLGWEPEVGLEDGLRRLWAWHREEYVKGR